MEKGYEGITEYKYLISGSGCLLHNILRYCDAYTLNKLVCEMIREEDIVTALNNHLKDIIPEDYAFYAEHGNAYFTTGRTKIVLKGKGLLPYKFTSMLLNYREKPNLIDSETKQLNNQQEKG